MAEFGNFKFTSGGLDLETKVHAGKTLTFTKFVVGDGTYTGDIRNLTALVNPIMNVEIARLKTQTVIDENNNPVKIATCGFDINTLELQSGFYLREVGLYAKDPDTNQEVLYKYGNAGNTADWIAPGTSTTISEKALNVLMYFSDTDSITAEVNTSIQYVTETDFDDAIDTLESEIAAIDLSWGEITGTLASQTDLKNALDAKVDKVTGGIVPFVKYSTDVKSTLNSTDYLLTGTYCLSIDGNTTGAPEVSDTTRIVLKTINTYSELSYLYGKYIRQDIYIPSTEYKYYRIVELDDTNTPTYSAWNKVADVLLNTDT